MTHHISTISCEDAIAFVCDATWGFAEVSPEYKFVWVNPAYCAILNAPADLIIGTTFQAWTHAEDILIDQELADKVAAGELPSYTLAKRYIQRGSTPQRQRVVWGMLSVAGKWVDKEFVGYRVQFRPYQDQSSTAQSIVAQVDWKWLMKWTRENWRTVITCLAVLSTLAFGGSERLLSSLREAQETKRSVDTVLQPSGSGQSSPQSMP